MKKSFFTVAGNRLLAENTYEMVLRGDSSAVKKPGQFVHIALDGFYLRRPISVCDWSEHSITMIYKTVGKGTAYMAGLEEGDRLEVLTGLGNGFDSKKSGNKPLLIGGGAGIPPLYALAKKLMQEQKQVFAILGFNRVDEVFYAEEFASLGVNVIITTVDGSVGRKGFVTDAMEIDMADYTYTYSCGPEPMLKAVYEKAVSGGQYSFEERIGCGFGACMGCACQTKYDSKRICREGPVLEKEEIVW